jgi:peptidyl-tRNA hydrolase
MTSDNDVSTHVYAVEDRVLVTFAKPITYLNLSPDAVDQFVRLLLECAQQIRNARGKHDETH